MKKFLSDISENEKNRILSLHENYKEILKNKILTEQLDMPKIQGSANDEPENALCKTNYCKTVNGTAQCTDGMLKDFELLSKYIDNTRDAADAYVIATTMATIVLFSNFILYIIYNIKKNIYSVKILPVRIKRRKLR